MFQYASILINQRLYFDTLLPTSSRVFKVSNFQLRHSSVFNWFVLKFTSFWGAMYEHLRVVPPVKRLRVPSCTRPDILGSG